MGTFKRAIELHFKKLSDDAVIPQQFSDSSAYLNLKAISVSYDQTHDAYIYKTGLACETVGVIAMYCHPNCDIYKTNFYLTDSVHIIDCHADQTEIRAVFKNRDSLETRINNAAHDIYDRLPWYQKLKSGGLSQIKDRLKEDFLNDPLKWAPYKAGDEIMQVWFGIIRPVNIVEVDKFMDIEFNSNETK